MFNLWQWAFRHTVQSLTEEKIGVLLKDMVQQQQSRNLSADYFNSETLAPFVKNMSRLSESVWCLAEEERDDVKIQYKFWY
jgi:hypothetical protein